MRLESLEPRLFLDAAALDLLKVSDNGRFLVHQDGRPFYYLADTAWWLAGKLSLADADGYFQDRAAKGFDVVQVAIFNSPNAYGQFPVLNNDPAQPNDAYFQTFDAMANEAAAHGLYLAIVPGWSNSVIGPNPIFNATNAASFGQYLGNRYAGKPVMWMLGGDGPATGFESVWTAMANGIQAGAAQAGAAAPLITYHPYSRQSSSIWFQNSAWLNFNTIQSGHGSSVDNYDLVANDYALSPAKPTFDGETDYEGIAEGCNPFNAPLTDYDARKVAYWGVFAGAFGNTYGAIGTWNLQTEAEADTGGILPWYQAVNLPGAFEMRYLRALMESRPFLTRIPDQSMIVGSTLGSTDHIQATRDSSGSYAFVYSASGKAFTVDMTRISGGTASAWWYNPRNGSATAAGQFATSGTQQFTPPSRGGGNDWVLVLDDATQNFAAPGGLAATPATPSIVQTRVISGSSVDVTWTDNATNETGYVIERMVPADGVWNPVATLGANTTSFRDTGLTAGATYYYRVRAQGATADSDNSIQAAATPVDGISIGTGDGLRTVFYNNVDFSGTDTMRYEPQAWVNWFASAPAPGISAGSYSVRFTGQLLAQKSETYTLHLQSDCGARLWINNQLLIDQWLPQSIDATASLAMNAGNVYSIRIDYFHNSGQAGLKLMWSSPTTPETVIPRSQLYSGRVLGGPGVTPTLPSAWSAQDVGTSPLAGSAAWNNGVFAVESSGFDVWSTSDAFQFVYEPLNGDGQIVARVASVGATAAWAKAGVMIRNGLAANAANAFMALSASSGMAFQGRTAAGASSIGTASAGTAPYWVKLVRKGNSFTGYKSADGATWTQVGSAITISMPSSVLVGLAVTACNTGPTNVSTFDNVSVAQTVPTAPTGHLDDPKNGASISADELNARKYIDITYSANDPMDTASILDAAPEFTLSGPAAAGVVVNGAPENLSGSVYRYSFTGNFTGGTVTLTFVAGSFLTTPGGAGLPDAKTFTVTGIVPPPPPPPAATPYPGPNPTSLPGTIELENFDSGGEAVAYHDLSPTNVGTYYRPTEAIDIEKCSEGGYEVGWNQPGEWLQYTVNVASSGTYNLDLRAAYGGANANGGTVHVECDGVDITGAITLPKTGGWQTWQTVTRAGVNLTAGTHALKLVMDSDGAGSTASTAYLSNLNWLRISVPAPLPPTGHLGDPLSGASISAAALNSRKYIDITYDAPNLLDAATVLDSAPEFTLAGAAAAGVVVNGAPVAVSSATYRYSFTGSFLPGTVSVSFVAGSVADKLGYTSPADTKSFTVTSPAPSLNLTSADIGAPKLAGSTALSNGVYTVKASGVDVWNNSDSFRFVYQTLTGNGTIIARVDSVSNTAGWAKAGLMMREVLAANSKNAFMAISATQGLAFQGRTATGGASAGVSGGAGLAPYWLKLVRSGSTFTGYKSTDGVTWTQVGSALTIGMNSTIYVGLAVTACNNTKLNTSAFSNVSIG